MKSIAVIILSFIAPLCVANDQSLSFGVGIGTSYSGLGGNISLLSATDKKYLSAGCVSHSSNRGTVCGAGLGWISTEFIDLGSNKHGLGLYAGVVGTEYQQGDSKAAYGLGAGYHYFFDGIDQPGAHFGFSIVLGNKREPNDKNTGLMLELGYQF